MCTSLKLYSPVTGVFLVALLCGGPQVGLADDSIEGRCLKNVRQVTSGFVKAGEGYFSPDGKTIIYQAVPREYPFYQIYTQSPAPNSRPRRISTGRGRTTCSYFHPQGRQLIFASSHLDPQLDATETAARKEQEEDRKSGKRRRYKWVFDPHMEIFRADVDGRDLVRLTTSPGYDAECAYSPDGSQIVFCSDRDGDPDIYIMNADGTGVKQLTDAEGYDGGPFFSPNGQWIVFRTDRKAKDRLQIHAIRTDGTNDVALTDNIGVNWAPYWHPTAPYIIWCGADHSDPRARPNYDLWLMKYQVQEGRLIKDRSDSYYGSSLRRRAARFLAGRQQADVDQQPHGRWQQPIVDRRFRSAVGMNEIMSRRQRSNYNGDSNLTPISHPEPNHEMCTTNADHCLLDLSHLHDHHLVRRRGRGRRCR